MSQSDLQRACEAVILEILRTSPTMRALDPRHGADDGDVEKPGIIVSAQEDENYVPLVAGAGRMSKVDMEVKLRASMRTLKPEDMQRAFGEIEGLVDKMGEFSADDLPSIRKFLYLLRMDNVGGDRGSDDKRRTWNKKFSFLAILRG